MYSVSEKFLASVSRSGKRKTVFDVYYGGNLLLSDIPVTGGSITYDRKSDVRASGSLTAVSLEADWTTLEPWGNEIRIRTGVVYDDNSEELVPLGWFRLEENTVSEGLSAAPQVQFYDRTRALMDTVVVPDQDYSGQLSSNIISGLVIYTLPNNTVDIEFGFPNTSLSGGSVFSNSHWDIIKEIVEGRGGEVFFNRDGEVIVRKAPAVTVDTTLLDAVYSFSVGTNLIDVKRQLTREGAYNGVAVYGAQNSDGTRPFGFVFDTDSRSNSNYYGSYGRKTIRLENSTVIDNFQATEAARQALKGYVGLVKNVSFDALCNPALDVGDIVTLQYFDGTVELHMLDSITFEFSSGSMSCTTRSVQYVGD